MRTIRRWTATGVAMLALAVGLSACGGGSSSQGSGASQDTGGGDAVDVKTELIRRDAVADATSEIESVDVQPPAACLTGQVCAADADCNQGERCNLTLVPPGCQRLYCAAQGEACDLGQGDTLCRPGFFCLEADTPHCERLVPGLGVVFLLDQSGSVSGFVEPDPAKGHTEMSYDAANLAITKWQQEQADPTVLQRLASDPKNYRIAALRDFVARLDKNDKLLVMTFNEDKPSGLVCAGPSLGTPTSQDCFARRRDWVAQGINYIDGSEGGRTPLWESLHAAITFLRSQSGLTAKHIVVLGDGPDTCHPSSDAYVGDPACASLGFGDVNELVASRANDVFLHFVQYWAIGYPTSDDRQAEAAEMTGGSYVFVDRTVMTDDGFKTALSGAVSAAISGQ